MAAAQARRVARAGVVTRRAESSAGRARGARRAAAIGVADDADREEEATAATEREEHATAGEAIEQRAAALE